MSQFIKVVFLASVCSCLGCGGASDKPQTAKASGVVTYKGQPVAGATVSFELAKAPRAGTGVTNDKGEFTIGTYGSDDGAIVGDHTVLVTKKPAAGGAGGAMKPEDYMKNMGKPGAAVPGADAKNEVPAKYSLSTTSDLKAKVEAGKDNKFKFDLVD